MHKTHMDHHGQSPCSDSLTAALSKGLREAKVGIDAHRMVYFARRLAVSLRIMALRFSAESPSFSLVTDFAAAAVSLYFLNGLNAIFGFQCRLQASFSKT